MRAVEETLEAVAAFFGGLERSVRREAIATSALREAPNAATLLKALRERHRVDVQVLSAEEEGRLGALAATASLPVRNGFVFDLGGGSLQLVRVREGEIVPLGSYPLGAVRMTERFMRRDRPRAQDIARLRSEVWRHLILVCATLDRSGDEVLVGLGGTVRTLARIQREALGRDRDGIHGARLTRADIEAIRRRLAAVPLRERRLPGLKAERADILLAGTVVVEEMMALANLPVLSVCARSVRHGFLIQRTFGTIAAVSPAVQGASS